MDDPESTRSSMFSHLRNNDEGAWEAFNKKYLPLFMKWARACGFRGPNADDLVSLIMLKIFEKMPTFEYDRKRGGFRSYWKTALNNLAGKLAQSEDRNQKLHEDAYRLLKDPEVKYSLLDVLVKVEEAEMIQEGVRQVRAKMGDDYWLTWHLTEERGLSVKEAASQLGISDSNFSTRKTRFSQAVKKLLGKMIDEPR